MNHSSHIDRLLQRIASGDDQEAAYEELQQLLRNDPDAATQLEMLLDGRPLPGELSVYRRADWDHIVDNVLRMDQPAIALPGKRRLWPYWSAAAAILLLAGVALYKFRPAPERPAVVQTSVVDVQPGGTRATLTLADGSVVTLDSTGNRVLQQGATAIHQQGGRLSYNSKAGETEVHYNVLRTPRGGQFQLRLPDGTAVWLNAASSIRFPTTFTGNERLVEVSGEVYLEVAQMAARPFRVKVNEQVSVQVLGTRFNLNAYADEGSINTTLLQGAVRVTKDGEAAVLQPGQQARVAEKISIVQQPDIDQVMAWKNGLFNFHNVELKEVMRQLSRWYDIEVVYQGNVPSREFWGKMGRNLTLAEALKGLEGTGINFRIEENGKKLVVLP
ncbi:FecR domain-containing protein [Chitinophaga horti]|uniref:FecR domain-containing protein n=1 Tax=Chitinophaga horti TaxID=2920382 RepID=A0ABY6IYS0_9BACT|nr:FecR family protein [Chitinophaga horti]UYQ91229.1 FecR domain-containing protein [Chitinophaga horti]